MKNNNNLVITWLYLTTHAKAHDNDNDNETMFIAKWHTVHVQRT